MVKIGTLRPPGGSKMVKIETQKAPKDAHEDPQDPPRTPKGAS